jgi:hypothetical protein
MAKELQPLDISHSGEVRRLAEEVQASEQARALQIDHKTVAILVPVSARRSRSRRGKPTSAADPLWNIVGLGSSDGPGDVAQDVDSYLSHALLPLEE